MTEKEEEKLFYTMLETLDTVVDLKLQTAMDPHLRVELWRLTGSAVGYRTHVTIWNAIADGAELEP